MADPGPAQRRDEQGPHHGHDHGGGLTGRPVRPATTLLRPHEQAKVEAAVIRRRCRQYLVKVEPPARSGHVHRLPLRRG
jgi:hypothetical protein